MKCTVLLLSVCLTMVGVGCSSLQQNQSQYQLLGPLNLRGVRVAISSSDREGVKQIVSECAAQWRLVDRTSTSFLPTVIASYSQDWNETQYPMNLVAFDYQGKIIVDLTQTSRDVGESPTYRARKDQLLQALKDKFGDRIMIPKLTERVQHVSPK